MFNSIAPNMQDIVEDMSERFPFEWRNAHRDYGQQDGKEGRVTVVEATEFMQLLASFLFNHDTRFGLNGKRGDMNDLSQDAISFKNPSGPGGVEIIDVIISAGTPGQRAAWNNVTQKTIDARTIGVFVQPRQWEDVITPPVQPQPPVINDFITINRKLDDILSILNKHFK